MVLIYESHGWLERRGAVKQFPEAERLLNGARMALQTFQPKKCDREVGHDRD